MAIAGGRVAAIGTHGGRCMAWRGPATRVIDAGGATGPAGVQRLARAFHGRRPAARQRVDLRQAPTPQAVRAAHRRAGAEDARGGMGPRRRLGRPALGPAARCRPASSSIRPAPATPVFVNRFDGHMARRELGGPEAGRRDGGHARSARAASSSATRAGNPTGHR
ncbi:MAG: hypothetical protein M0C28_16220 [Candidatus Moduliflexus flocculans]|nr:hypothetical protein [Candidatus Moduliflexus flocculans]